MIEVAIIGAGIAGASLAAELAELAGPRARATLYEAEAHPGYHATGRSAAFWEACYGGPQIVPLTLASHDYLDALGVLNPRGALYLARGGDEAAVAAFIASFEGTGAEVRPLARPAIEGIVPGLRGDWQLALHEPGCADIDVAALHQHYLAIARRAGVALVTDARLLAAEREGASWRLDFGPLGERRADVLVDAAGAWADPVAALAGAAPLGIAPLRRTVAQIRTDPPPPAVLPLVLDLAAQFYFKPEAGRLWLSPHDETPSPACDAAPEELDVALAIDRFERVVDWRVQAVERKWAGLRSFAPDRRSVYGYDARREGFFWCAGQGGFGIQTAPAAARLAAQLLLDAPRDAMTEALDPALYSPARFG